MRRGLFGETLRGETGMGDNGCKDDIADIFTSLVLI